MLRVITLLALLLSAFITAAEKPGQSSAADHIQPAYDLIYEVHLLDAMPNRGKAGPLSVYLRRVNGAWQPAIGLAPQYNTSFHVGVLRSFEASEDGLVMDLGLSIRRDAWVPGGHGRWQLQLSYDDQRERWIGQHSGRVLGQDVSGYVEVVQSALKAQSIEETKTNLNQRPRLLFRQEQREHLRQRLASKFGQTAQQYFTNGVGFGLQYQLHGDQAFADQAMEATATVMAATKVAVIRASRIVYLAGERSKLP